MASNSAGTRKAGYEYNRFAALRSAGSTDSDDYDYAGGGVSLRDFAQEDGNKPAMMGAASKNLNESTPVGNPPTPNHGGNMAPIGTGRPSDCNASAAAGAYTGNLHATGGIEQPSVNGFSAATYQTAPMQNQTDTASTAYYNPGGNAYVSDPYTTSNSYGSMTHYPQSSTAIAYQYGAAPAAYNTAPGYHAIQSPIGPADTPGLTLDQRFQQVSLNPQATPSHVPKQVDNDMDETPGSSIQYKAYNQTEPRNFAPRTAGSPSYLPPPPAFNLGQNAKPKDNSAQAASHSAASDADPFFSPGLTRRAAPAPTPAPVSQAMVLSSISEDNQLDLAPNPVYYGPVPAEIRALRSEHLNSLTDGPTGLPTQDVALSPDNFPFIESCTQAGPVSYGVVKIKNIPFGTRRAEIIAFLGRNSKILNDNQEPVHIIMERVSSKTQDAYVEFMSLADAMRAVERHQINVQRGRLARLGDRPVDVQLSSQSALMKDLFPLAAGVFWEGSKPVIQAPVPGEPWKTFKGFVTEEEMTMLVKHVEIPQRSPYSKECPQRPYECMISTLKKLPWYMSNHITVRQRYAVYDATCKLIWLLTQSLERPNRFHEATINVQLLKRLVTAAMLCPGFSVVQKDNIAVVAQMPEERARMFNQPRFADMWTHLYALCPKPGIPLDVLEWYIAIIREETTRSVYRKPLNEQYEIQAKGAMTKLYFGYLWYELNLPSGKEFDNLTLRDLARRELAAMERTLRRAFPRRN